MKTRQICGAAWRAGTSRRCWGAEPLHICVRDAWHPDPHECSCLATYSARLEVFETPTP